MSELKPVYIDESSGELKEPRSGDTFVSEPDVSFDTISDLTDYKIDQSPRTKTANVMGYYSAGDGGGGTFYWDSDEDKSNHDGRYIIDPDHSVTPDLDDSNWTSPENSGSGCWVKYIEGLEQLSEKYFSYNVGDKPSITGIDGIIGAYFKDSGLLQKLEEGDGNWVEIGEPLTSFRTLNEQVFKNNSAQEVEWIGHAAFPAYTPRNTIPAISAAKGVMDSIEIDLNQTSDDEIIVAHGPDLGGTPIADQTLLEVQSVDVGSGKFSGTYPPTLEDALRVARGEFKMIYLDIKDNHSVNDAGITKITNIVSNLDLTQHTRILALFNSSVEKFAEEGFALLGRRGQPDNSIIDFLSQYENTVWRTSIDHMSQSSSSYVQYARSKGVGVILEHVDTPENYTLAQELGVTRIMTENILKR